MKNSISRVKAGKNPFSDEECEFTERCLSGIFSQVEGCSSNYAFEGWISRLAVPHWLQFPSQCWWSVETLWRKARDPPPNPTTDKPLLGDVFLSTNGYCFPIMSLQAVGIHPLMLPEFRKQVGVVHFHREGLEWHGVKKIFLNVGQRLGKPRLLGHGIDDLTGFSNSWSVIYKCTFQSQQVTTVTEFSSPSPLPFNFSSQCLEMFPIIGSHKQRHDV